MGSVSCIVAIPLYGCNTTMSILSFTIGMSFSGFVYSGFISTNIDMAPDFARTLLGLTTGFGNLPGFISPLVASAFYSESRGGVSILSK